MVELIMLLFFLLLALFVGIYGIYFACVRRWAKKPWGLAIDNNYQPKVSILIPVHNEEENISKKLDNIGHISYPKTAFEVIVVDDGSDDNTLGAVKDFVRNNQHIDIKVSKQNRRVGKSAALNRALSLSSNDIVIVSDADTLWDADMLERTMPYLSDQKIGAVTAAGINRNENESWITKGERTYLNLVSLIRNGESKTHSTIRFEGGFCAYKREAFDLFDTDTGADDSGTALNVVQKGWRSILVPEALFYTSFPSSLLGKVKTKVRRANQLTGLWIKCLKLMVKRQLLLPERIALPEMLLFLVNPLVLIASCIIGIATIALYPFSTFSLAIVLIILFLSIFARRMFLEILIDNLILVYALFSYLLGRRYVSWENR